MRSPSYTSIIEPGYLTTIQDSGRSAYRDQGFPIGGSMDRETPALLNVLLGNPAQAPVLEFFQKGPRLSFSTDTVVAIAGIGISASLDSTQVTPWTTVRIKAGDILDCGALKGGVWGYLAIAGGFSVPEFFGSCSTHPNLGIGGFHGTSIDEGEKIPPIASDIDFLVMRSSKTASI